MMRYHHWLIMLLLCLVLPVAAAAQSGDEPDCASVAPPGSPATYYLGLGAAATAQGEYTRAIFVYTCALESDPTYAPAFVNRGLAHAAQFNFPEALSDYNRALELDSNLAAAYNNRGVLYSQQANFGLAIADFTVVTVIAPDDVPAFVNRALVHAAEGNYDLALADLEQAVALDPANARVHQAFGAVYLALAAQSYQTYQEVAGRPASPDADGLLDSIQFGLESEDSSALLSLQTSAQAG